LYQVLLPRHLSQLLLLLGFKGCSLLTHKSCRATTQVAARHQGWAHVYAYPLPLLLLLLVVVVGMDLVRPHRQDRQPTAATTCYSCGWQATYVLGWQHAATHTPAATC
jgi:hypothetical protein